jgi:hypothetical protein
MKHSSIHFMLATGFHVWAGSSDEMEALGHVIFAQLCKPGNVVLLHGQLGAGEMDKVVSITSSFAFFMLDYILHTLRCSHPPQKFNQCRVMRSHFNGPVGASVCTRAVLVY